MELVTSMKFCNSCKETRSVNEFARNASKPDGLQAHCRPCKKKHDAAYYKANRQAQAERNRQRTVWLREQKKEYLRNHPCVDCGFTDIRALQFDHVRGNKKMAVGHMMRTYSWDTILKEIEKCEVRCANYHSIVTHERRESEA